MHEGIDSHIEPMLEEFQRCVETFILNNDPELADIWMFDEQDVTGDREVKAWYTN